MKYLSLLSFLAFFCACSSNQTIVSVPANQVMELDYPHYEVFKATLKNKSLKGLEVAVLSKYNDEEISSFGLGTKGDVDVFVKADNKLVFKNDNNSSVAIKMQISPASAKVFEREGDYISFTLRNNGAKSIPLLIPSVMNPNLSPFSKSGVDLKIGQEILFRANGKKYVLLTVDKSIKNGDELDVGKLMADRKTELGIR